MLHSNTGMKDYHHICNMRTCHLSLLMSIASLLARRICCTTGKRGFPGDQACAAGCSDKQHQHRFLYGKVLLFRRVVVRTAAAAVLQRPAPAGSEIQQMVTFACIDKCVAAAQGLLDLIRSNLGTWFLPPTWYTVFGKIVRFARVSASY